MTCPRKVVNDTLQVQHQQVEIFTVMSVVPAPVLAISFAVHVERERESNSRFRHHMVNKTDSLTKNADAIASAFFVF